MDGRDLEPRAGCTKISPGCKHCYAERSLNGFAACGHPFEQGFDLRLVPQKLGRAAAVERAAHGLRELDERPVSGGVPDLVTFRGSPPQCSLARWHTYQVLTKRSEKSAGHAARAFEGCREVSRISGGVFAWRTASTACRGSPTFRPRQLLCDSCRSSRCWRISESFLWKASPGSSSAAKAGPARDR